MKLLQHTASLVVFTCLSVPSAGAATRQEPRPQIFVDLLNCRQIIDNNQRLACFDQQVGSMQAASEKDEVVVLDKTELRKTRRTLFGFSFPKLPFLNGNEEKAGNDDDEEFTRLESTITSAKSIGYGKWQIVLEDGAQWATTEPISYGLPKAGLKIEIKRASMGSFLGKVEGGRAVRMKRVG